MIFKKYMVVQIMTLTYRIRLFIILFISALILMVSFLSIDYQRLKKQTMKDHEVQIEQATESVLYALDSIDRAYHYLDQETGLKMEEYSKELQNKYKDEQDFSSWDFDALAEEYGMDIYILNDENEIIYSNVDEEVGIEFAVCCKTLDTILHERREAGKLFIDEIDRDQETGDAKKYSYIATDDKKYLIELGYALKNEVLFQNFNFTSVTEDIVDKFSFVEDVHVLNYGGQPYGTAKIDSELTKRREAFEEVRETNETVEVEQTYLGESYMFRYVPYRSDYDASSTQIKVVEIMYDKQLLDNLLSEHLKTFIIQFLIAVVVTGIAVYVLTHILSRPVYLAYYDPLTKLKNQTSLEVDIKKLAAEKNKIPVALFFIDIDKFKSINASLGHEKSNQLLQCLGDTIQDMIQDEDGEAYRNGGDEFAMLLQDVTEADAQYFATALLEHMDEKVQENTTFNNIKMSISIGVAIATDTKQIVDLFKRADLALYEAKKKGQNQYHIHNEDEEIQLDE